MSPCRILQAYACEDKPLSSAILYLFLNHEIPLALAYRADGRTSLAYSAILLQGPSMNQTRTGTIRRVSEFRIKTFPLWILSQSSHFSFAIFIYGSGGLTHHHKQRAKASFQPRAQDYCIVVWSLFKRIHWHDDERYYECVVELGSLTWPRRYQDTGMTPQGQGKLFEFEWWRQPACHYRRT